MKTIRRLRELSDPEALRLFAWSLLTVLGATALVRTLPLPTLLSHFGRQSSRRSERKLPVTPDICSLDRARRYSHAIIISLLRSRRPCLLRSLVLYRYCCKQGVPIAIHFGVKSGSNGLDGHSWITLDGAPFGESKEGLRSYVAVYSYPAGSDGAGPHQALAAVGGQP
jgi:hypothetical protein